MSVFKTWTSRYLPRKNSFAVKMGLATAGVAAAVILLSSTLSFVTTRSRIIAAYEWELEAQSHRAEARLAMWFASTQSDIEGLAQNTLLCNALADSVGRDAYLRTFFSELKKIGGIRVHMILCDFMGRPVIASPNLGLVTVPQEIVQGVIDSGKPHCELMASGDDIALTMIWPVIYPNTGHPEGAISCQFSLHDLVASLILSQNFQLKVSGLQGGPTTVLKRGNSKDGDISRIFTPSVPELISKYSFQYEAWLDAKPLERDLLGLALRLLALSVAAICVIAPLSLALTRKLLGRLCTLENSARNVIDQKSPLETSFCIEGNDEIASLGQVFDQMLAALETANAALLDEAEKRYRELVEFAPLGIFQSTPQGRYIAVNNRLAEMYGYESAQELIDSVRSIPEQLYVDQEERDLRTAASETETTNEGRRFRKDGSIIWVSVSKRAVFDQTGALLRYEGFVRDITKRKLAEEALEESNRRLEELSVTDGLTGIANRRHFDEVLATEYARHTRFGGELSLILLDIDHFKAFNDSYGHVAGDECLRQVARVLTEFTGRPADIAARYGGEEFACILPETSVDGAAILGEKILRAIFDLAIPHTGSDIATYVTVSLGCATTLCEVNGSALDLVTQADKQLYRAKAGGRNQVRYAGMCEPA